VAYFVGVNKLENGGPSIIEPAAVLV